MNPVQHLALQKVAETGMDRFFSLKNLDRYRRLADDEIAAAERSRVLEVLASEWDAFTRECRKPSATRVRPLPEHVAFRSRDPS
jgi:hypothetical protein